MMGQESLKDLGRDIFVDGLLKGAAIGFVLGSIVAVVVGLIV